MKEHKDKYLVVLHGEVVSSHSNMKTALKAAEKTARENTNPVCIDAIIQQTVARVYPNGSIVS